LDQQRDQLGSEHAAPGSDDGDFLSHMSPSFLQAGWDF
jgi:hypothetical protein